MRKSILNTKDKAPACAICVHGVLAPDGESVLCVKTGIRLLDSSCRSFKYDPLKRVPKRTLNLGEFTADDFKLTSDDFEIYEAELKEYNEPEKDNLSEIENSSEDETDDLKLDDNDTEFAEGGFHTITLKDL